MICKNTSLWTMNGRKIIMFLDINCNTNAEKITSAARRQIIGGGAHKLSAAARRGRRTALGYNIN